MIKISDCNSCCDRNCQENVYGRIQFNCKKYQPHKQPLAKLAECALANNSQGLYENLLAIRAKLPSSLKEER